MQGTMARRDPQAEVVGQHYVSVFRNGDGPKGRCVDVPIPDDFDELLSVVSYRLNFVLKGARTLYSLSGATVLSLNEITDGSTVVASDGEPFDLGTSNAAVLSLQNYAKPTAVNSFSLQAARPRVRLLRNGALDGESVFVIMPATWSSFLNACTKVRERPPSFLPFTLLAPGPLRPQAC